VENLFLRLIMMRAVISKSHRIRADGMGPIRWDICCLAKKRQGSFHPWGGIEDQWKPRAEGSMGSRKNPLLRQDMGWSWWRKPFQDVREGITFVEDDSKSA